MHGLNELEKQELSADILQIDNQKCAAMVEYLIGNRDSRRGASGQAYVGQFSHEAKESIDIIEKDDIETSFEEKTEGASETGWMDVKQAQILFTQMEAMVAMYQQYDNDNKVDEKDGIADLHT